MATRAADSTARRAVRENGARLCRTGTLGHHIRAARDPKLEVLIGQTPIFLQVSEVERRAAALFVDRGEVLDLQSRRIHADAERLELRLAVPGHELQRQQTGCSTGQWCE